MAKAKRSRKVATEETLTSTDASCAPTEPVQTLPEAVPATVVEIAPPTEPEPEPPTPAAPPARPVKFAKGVAVRYRTWNKPEGELDRKGTVISHGKKWISIAWVNPKGKTVTDWADASVPGTCESVTGGEK